MFRKLLKLVAYVLLMAFIVVTLAFTSSQSKNTACRNIQVEFFEEEVIKLNKDEIIRLIKSADNQLVGKQLNQINSELIETEIEKHQAILNAEVYKVLAKDSTSYKGILAVKIKHREPVVRIMSSSGSYYLDEFGGKVPVSTNYTANVLVTTGHFDEKFAKNSLLPFVLFIEKDEFWNAQIQQIHIEQNGNILLTPLVGNHLVEFGKIDSFQEKLRNMKAFYEQVISKDNWNKYETVSLKYKNQVVAKKR